MKKRLMTMVALLAALAGCQNGCNPSSPSVSTGPTPVPTPVPVTLLSENYEGTPYTGAWADMAANAEMAGTTSNCQSGIYSIVFSSASQISNASDHFRNDWGTAGDTTTATTPLTTSFYINFGYLANVTDTVKIHLEVNAVVSWLLEIVGDGQAFRFNNQLLSPCAACPAASSTAWHLVTIKSTGQTTALFSFNGTPVTGYTALFSGGVSPDGPGDMMHLTFGPILNVLNSRLFMDNLMITTP